MNKTFTTWTLILAMATTAAASVLTIRLAQEGSNTQWSINQSEVTLTQLESLLVRLARADTNQFIYIVTQTNVPSGRLVQTIGVVQRTGLHNLVLISAGVDGTNAGTWQVTVDATKVHIPTCIANEHSFSGFQRENIIEYETFPTSSENDAPSGPP